MRAKLFQLHGNRVAAEKEHAKPEGPSTATSGEIQALKDRLRTAKMFEKYAKSTFLRACEQSGASNDQASLDLEKAAKTGVDRKKKRSVSPDDEVNSREFKRRKF